MTGLVLLNSNYFKAEVAQCKWNQEVHTAFAVYCQQEIAASLEAP